MRNSFKNSIKHITALLLRDDCDQVLLACDEAECRFEYHCEFDFFRVTAFIRKQNWVEAKKILGRLNSPHDCTSPLCRFKLGAFLYAWIAYEKKHWHEFNHFIRHFLRKNPDDIIGLFLRGTVYSTRWRQHQKTDHLKKAIADFRNAYDILGRLSVDDKVYCLRHLMETHPDKTTSLFEDIHAASLIQTFFSHSVSTHELEDGTDAHTEMLFDEGGFIKAGSLRVVIGLELAQLLLLSEESGARLDEIREILSICQNGEALYQVYSMIIICGMHIDLHEERLDRSDFHQLDKADAVIDDLLRLNAHPLPTDILPIISALESDIDQARREA